MILQALKAALYGTRSALRSPLFNDDMLANPYPTYEHLRSTDPVYWDEVDGRWVLTRYADIVTVLRSPAASAGRNQAIVPLVPPAFRQLYEARSNTMINCDGDRHKRLRLLVNKAFTARAVEDMTDKIRRLVDGFLDAVQGRGRLDVIADLAYPLPVTVIAEMLGVPPEDRDRFKKWSDELALIAGGAGSPAALGVADYRRIAASSAELTAYLREVVTRRRVEPRNDLLTALAQAEEAGDRLSEDELYANATLILVAGHETTTNLIGNGTLALLRHPEQAERLRSDPSLLPSAVEELLRYDSPVQMTSRVLTADLEVGGKQLRRGQLVLLVLGAANRDPEQFADPDRLDVGRADNKHLAFGLGSHFCLGAQLARLEGRIAFEALLRCLPNLHLQAGAEPRYRRHFNLRGLESLPAAFGGAASAAPRIKPAPE
jgi:cytochrome P450